MYFNKQSFFRALRLSLIDQPFRLRRWAFVIFFTGLYLFFLGLIVIGRALDHLFAGGFRRKAIRQPVFIIAPPRSGTTLLQTLLSFDEERFVYWKMHQTIFPVVCYQRVFETLFWLDRKLGAPVARALAWCERKWFGGWDDLHRMRLNQPEEDHALFLYPFASEAIFMLFPFVEELWEVGFPDALAAADRRKLMAYYRGCLQRHIHADGGRRTMLVKATGSCGAVESLAEEFPDARFITIARHPAKSIPSSVSLYVPAWQAHSPEIPKDGAVSKSYARLTVEWYRHLFRFGNRIAAERYHRIDYRDLVQDPRGVVEALYQHFGWSMSSAFRTWLDMASKRQRTFKSKHRYSLEDFGLSKAWVEQELGDVITAYELDEDRYEGPGPLERST